MYKPLDKTENIAINYPCLRFVPRINGQWHSFRGCRIILLPFYIEFLYNKSSLI